MKGKDGLYDACEVAEFVIDYSNEMGYPISAFKVESLLYFIQAYFLLGGERETDSRLCFRDRIEARERELTRYMMERMQAIEHINIIGSADPDEHVGIVTFTVDGVHPHDIAEIMNSDRVCIRAGHHCAQPLMKFIGYPSTARASLCFYNTEADIDRFIESLSGLRKKMGY